MLTGKDLEDIGGDIAPLLRQELAKLEARMLDLESKSLRHCGVWQASQAHKASSVVTMDGALFVTVREGVASGR